MFDIRTKTLDFGGRELTFETGKMAQQADGAVVAKIGETSVLATAVGAKTAKEGMDFFSLSVHYIEKYYAAGRIPGGFNKREGRPSDHEVLTSRLIDRPIRPLFADGFYNEVQVIINVLSQDKQNQSDVLALNAASAALSLSGMPFQGPVGAARVGYIDGDYVLNPTMDQLENSQLDLVVAGTAEGVLMVESEAHELSEDVMLGAVMFGWKGFQPIIQAIEEMAAKAAKPAWEMPEPTFDAKAVAEKFASTYGARVKEAFGIQDKQARSNRLAEIKAEAWAAEGKQSDLSDEENTNRLAVMAFGTMWKKLEAGIVRGAILAGEPRIDGRETTKVRQIVAETNVLPRVHGSALFTRGETQALAVATLGTGDDEKIMDTLSGSYRDHFMLHYNFPPFSVGECGRIGATGRREIGHGYLARRAISPLLPTKEQFPYTMRVVSEVLMSNGSSSMATVCGTSLALMDAGVPMPRPVAGIAMGLIKEGDDYAVLTDILGDEDHLGDMDFKVAGTDQGITALQMDIKITSINEAIMKQALAQAKDGRVHILGKMAEARTESREEMSDNAPRITKIKINPEKIRDVIGSGGKTIREIVETTNTKIDIEDDGTIKIAATDGDDAKAAIQKIKDLTDEPEVGKTYRGKVVKIMDFGAFVNFMGAKDGLVHISQISHERINAVSDHLSEGDEINVKVVGIDDRGKIKLTMKDVPQEEDAADLNEEAA